MLPEIEDSSRNDAVFLLLDAVVIEAEVAGCIRALRVPDPLRLDEHDAVDHGEAEGQTAPKDADRARVTHVIGVVDVRSDRRVRIHHEKSFVLARWLVGFFLVNCGEEFTNCATINFHLAH